MGGGGALKHSCEMAGGLESYFGFQGGWRDRKEF